MRFQSFDEMLKYHAKLTPDAPAIKTTDGQLLRTISYASLCKEIQDRADSLRSEKKTCVGLLCDGSYSCIVNIFAAVKAGMQLVLLNENADSEQITYTDCDLLVGDEELTRELDAALTSGVSDGQDKILFFTSGTTAKTKAVVLTQQSLCASAYNGGALLPLTKEDTLMCMLPLDHVFGFVCGVLWGLSCGACVALGRGPRHYFDDLTFFRPTVLSAVPLLLGFLLKNNLLNDELHTVLIGAGDCPQQILFELKAKGKRVSFGYGLTETSSGVALSLDDDPYAMTICPDASVSIADDGEILIADDTCMMRGYYKDPESTAATLQNGLLHTGDIGKIDPDGKLHIIGRKKEILVLQDGTKIFLPEYEQTLRFAIADRDYAVIVHEGAPALLIVGNESERDAIRSAIAPVMRDLPLGRRIRSIFFSSTPLPRTATGKIKRWELQQKAGI